MFATNISCVIKLCGWLVVCIASIPRVCPRIFGREHRTVRSTYKITKLGTLCGMCCASCFDDSASRFCGWSRPWAWHSTSAILEARPLFKNISYFQTLEFPTPDPKSINFCGFLWEKNNEVGFGVRETSYVLEWNKTFKTSKNVFKKIGNVLEYKNCFGVEITLLDPSGVFVYFRLNQIDRFWLWPWKFPRSTGDKYWTIIWSHISLVGWWEFGLYIANLPKNSWIHGVLSKYSWQRPNWHGFGQVGYQAVRHFYPWFPLLFIPQQLSLITVWLGYVFTFLWSQLSSGTFQNSSDGGNVANQLITTLVVAKSRGEKIMQTTNWHSFGLYCDKTTWKSPHV